MSIAAAVRALESEREELLEERRQLQATLHQLDISLEQLDRALQALQPLIAVPADPEPEPAPIPAQDPEPEPEPAPAPEPEPEPAPVVAIRPAACVEADDNDGPPTDAQKQALDEVLQLLDRPEWVEGAVLVRTTWVRTDGRQWECSCAKKCRTLGQLKQHLLGVTDPVRHAPLIRAAVEVPVRRKTDQPAADASPTAMVKGLPYGCACYSRFPTTYDWSQHVKDQRPADRRRHRLVDQPKATMVPTGLPKPKPTMEPLKPAVAALAERTKVTVHRDDVGVLA